jgi:hypothetical protein
MTYTTLASIVKYPFPSCLAGKKSKFGFFTSEEEDYLKIARELGIKRINSENEPPKYARHPLVYLVEAADDICYQMMDIEDAYKLKPLTPKEAIGLYLLLLDEKQKSRVEKVFSFVSDGNEQLVVGVKGQGGQNAEGAHGAAAQNGAKADLSAEGEPILLRNPVPVVGVEGGDVSAHIGAAEQNADDSHDERTDESGHGLHSLKGDIFGAFLYIIIQKRIIQAPLQRDERLRRGLIHGFF